jgi:hypothetical protein
MTHNALPAAATTWILYKATLRSFVAVDGTLAVFLIELI